MKDITVILVAVTIVAAALSGCATGQYGSVRTQQPVKYAKPVGHDPRTFHDGQKDQ